VIRYATAYGAAAALFLALDFLWIGLVGAKAYKAAIGEIMLQGQIRIAPAIAFYVLYLAAIVVLAIRPALQSGSWVEAAVLGAILGLAAYGTYALTDQSILRVWATQLTLLDMAWGAVVSAAAASAGYFAARQFDA
jgi:uncharacterized membrane protein